MNEVSHMTPDLLERFASRDLRASDVFAVERHLRACEACARAAGARAGVDLAALRRHFSGDDPALLEHPDRATELAPYARGRLDAVGRELVASHLDECGECTAAVARIRASRRVVTRRWWLAAAAVLALGVAGSLVMRRTLVGPIEKAPVVVHEPKPALEPAPHNPRPQPEPETQIAAGYGNPEWDALVSRATQTGRLPVPGDLASLRAPEEVLRGQGEENARVQPAGKVIDEVRPTFSWPSREGASYTVFVFDGDREITRSSALSAPTWTADRDLPRGRTLSWEVEAASGETIETLPAPPAPQARFRIATTSAHQELDRARALHPRDDLLLGILYARAGLLDDAAASLRRAARTNPAAKQLLDNNLPSPD
jgi:hypothetical protein